MACKMCAEIADASETGGPYVIRNCPQCGRAMKVRESGAHGIGIQIRKDDQFVIPADFLKISANPLKGNAHLTKFGLNWFAELVFGRGMERRKDDYLTAMAEEFDSLGEFLKNSSLLVGRDIEDPGQSEDVYNILKENREKPEWWAYVSSTYMSIAKDAIENQNAALAAWASSCAERFRSLYIFKENFEEVVWMGHSAKRLTDLLQIWDRNKTNSSEEFWQVQFQSHSLALAQIFSVPVTLIEGKAYVGGQGIDRSDARFVDFLFSGGNTSEAILIEIKTPVTPLIQKTAYRKNVYSPSSQLTGSVVQIADYRRTISREFDNLNRDKNLNLSAFNPKSLIIIGNTMELSDNKKRSSFDMFRSSVQNTDIVTFDELFLKIERLAELFNLIRSK